MPKKPAAPAKPTLRRPEFESVYPPKPAPLELDDRLKLKALFESEVFRKAWANLKSVEFTAFLPDAQLTGPDAGQAALKRLCRMQGWSTFATALLAQAEDPRPKRQPVLESYPDSGLPIPPAQFIPQPSKKP